MLDLRELADFSLTFGIETLRAGRFLRVMATVFDQDDKMHILTDDGTVQQEQFIVALRKMVTEFDAKAVCFLADAKITKVTSPEAIHRIALGESFTSAEILKRKWGIQRDAIICTIERPNEIAIFHQYYRRNAHGAIILEELQTGNPDKDALGTTSRTGMYRCFEQPATVQ